MKSHYSIKRGVLKKEDKFIARRAMRQYRKYLDKGHSYRNAFILYAIDDRKLGWTLTAQIINESILLPKDRLSLMGVKWIYEGLKGGDK